MATSCAGGGGDGGGRPSLGAVNPALTCALCKGYLINAMTLIRCMHSFCKSCINRHLSTSSSCPTCQQRVFRSRMDDHMMPDAALQSIVYKSVPGLFANEMQRRWDFYEQNRESPAAVRDRELRSEDTGVPLRPIFTAKDCISLALEHRQGEPDAPKFLNMYLSCPADVPVWVIIKFIRNKLSPPASLAVHLHLEKLNVNLSRASRKGPVRDRTNNHEDKDRLLLDPDLKLIDVCYIAEYRFEAPLKLSFKFVQFDPSLTSRPLTSCEVSRLPVESATKMKISAKQQPATGKSAVLLANGGNIPAAGTVQYGKFKVDTKSIDMAGAALLNGGAAKSGGGGGKSRTYSRAAGNMVPSQLNALNVLDPCADHEAAGDSTEEEEADNWDSNVSTTIDRTLTTQQQQQSSGDSRKVSGSNGSNSPASHPGSTNSSKQHLLSQQQQQRTRIVNGNSTNENRHTTQGLGRSGQPHTGSNSGKHSKASNAHKAMLTVAQPSNGVNASAANHHKKNQPIVMRPQSLKVTSPHLPPELSVTARPGPGLQLQQQSDIGKHQNASATKQTAPHLTDKVALNKAGLPGTGLVPHPAPVSHHKPGAGHRNSYKTSTAIGNASSTLSGHHYNHHHSHHTAGPGHKPGQVIPSLVISPTTASASTVAGKPPTVLKIKLNTSPTTSETLTITSPPIRDSQRASFEKNAEPEYPAVTSIKIKPIIAPSPTPAAVQRKSPNPAMPRDTRGSSVDGRKKRKSDEDKKASSDEKKPRKAKTKKGSSSQALINNAAFVSEQATDLLGTQNFGWGSAALLWESQLRIPSPLTVPFTVSFARRQASQLREREQVVKNKADSNAKLVEASGSATDQARFLESNFQLAKQAIVTKQPQNRIWRMRRQHSPPPPPVKLPPPDFVMSPTLQAVLKVMADDKVVDDGGPDSATETDVSDVGPSKQTGSDPFLASGSSGDINADVFRMEFPVAAVEQDTPADPLASPGTGAVLSTADRTPQAFRPLASCSLAMADVGARPKTLSSSTVKFSISSILAGSSGTSSSGGQLHRQQGQQPNVQETIELCINNLSRFFWALETCSERTRCRLAEACLFKRPVLEKILAIVRKLTIVVAPNQIERVLQLESAVEKYFLEPPEPLMPPAVVPVCAPIALVHRTEFGEGTEDRAEPHEPGRSDPGEEQSRDVKAVDVIDDNCNRANVIEETKPCVAPVIDPVAGTRPEGGQPPEMEAMVVETALDRKLDVVQVKSEAEPSSTEQMKTGDEAMEVDEARATCDEVKKTYEVDVKVTDRKDTAMAVVAEVKDDKDFIDGEQRRKATENGTATAEGESKNSIEIEEKMVPEEISENSPKKEEAFDKLDRDEIQCEERKPDVDGVIKAEVVSALSSVVAEVAESAEACRLEEKSEEDHEEPLHPAVADDVVEEDQTGESSLDSSQEVEPTSEAPGGEDLLAEEAMEVDEDSTSSEDVPCFRLEDQVLEDRKTVAEVIADAVEVVCSKADIQLYGFPGAFGYNMCRMLVPYKAKTPTAFVSYRGPSSVSHLMSDSIIKRFLERPLRVPAARNITGAVSTCATRPILSRSNSMELTLYRPRSPDIVEHLFYLAGLIPDRVPIPLQVHDYILNGRPNEPQRCPGGGETPLKRPRPQEVDSEAEGMDSGSQDHPLFELIKRRALEVPALPSTSPSFGDLGEMDVHRWEEVGAQNLSATAGSLGNVLSGGLNVH